MSGKQGSRGEGAHRREGKGWVMAGGAQIVALLSCAVILSWLAGASITTLVVMSVTACLTVGVTGTIRGAYAMSLVRRAPRAVAEEWGIMGGVFDLVAWGTCISVFPLLLYFSVPDSWQGLVGVAIILAALCGLVWNAWMLWGVGRVIARLKVEIA